jgi:Spy/CpxP family protein refolding chaperone
MNWMMIALMLTMGAPAFARNFAEKKVEHLASKLALDAASADKLRALMVKHHEQVAPLRKEAWETRSALKAELANAKPDQRRVLQLTDQLTRGRQQMMTLRTQHMAELKAQLTPEQYAQLLLSRGGHHGRRHKHDGARDAAPSAE